MDCSVSTERRRFDGCAGRAVCTAAASQEPAGTGSALSRQCSRTRPPVSQQRQQVQDADGAVVDIDLTTALGPGPQLPKSWGRSIALTKIKPSQIDRLGAHCNHTTAPPGLVYHRGDRQLSPDEHGPAGSRAGGIKNATLTNRFDRCRFDHQLSHPVGCCPSAAIPTSRTQTARDQHVLGCGGCR